LNLISQRLDTICQIKPKYATVLFIHLFTSFYTTKHSLRRGALSQWPHRSYPSAMASPQLLIHQAECVDCPPLPRPDPSLRSVRAATAAAIGGGGGREIGLV
jgi:hypothetical protein